MRIFALGRYGNSAPGSVARIDLAARNFAGALHDLLPAVVVHCAGPFQGQGYRAGVTALFYLMAAKPLLLSAG
jgi:hypothetical protein